MRYLGDFTPGKIVRIPFNSNKADGTPITLAGTPAVAVYKDASTTESTAGVTLTVDFDARTGLHQVVIDTSADGTFYAAGSDFRAVLTAGTVDSTSVVGVVVGGFSLANRSALRPTTADRTLGMDSNGRPGIDWSNVGTPASTVNLSGTTISTSQAIASVSGNVGGVNSGVNLAAPDSRVIRSNTCGAGSTTSAIVLDAGASATDNYYLGRIIRFTGGPALDQSASIVGYVGSTKTATISLPLRSGTAPASGDAYTIFANDVNVLSVANAAATTADGTAQAGGASTITLAATASTIDNFYKYRRILIVAGTGKDQERTVTGYVGSTKLATVDRAWDTAPDSTSQYAFADAADVTVTSNLDKTGYTASTVTDKTGYAITQSFPANFSALAIDASGRLDLGKWLGQAVSLDGNNFPNVNARDYGGTVVTGGLPNTAAPPSTSAVATAIWTDTTASDLASAPAGSPGNLLANNLDTKVSTRLAASGYTAPDNATLNHLGTTLQSDGSGGYQFTVLSLANAPAGGGGGSTDWTAAERNQLRYRLGIDGAAATPSAVPNLPVAVADKTGFKLAADGLDSIDPTEPTGPPSNWRAKLTWLFMRFGNAGSRSPTAITIKKTGGATATTQAITDDGAGNETQTAVS